MWDALLITLSFAAFYAFRIADESRKLAKALSETELVLQREQYFSDINGLAAAAAHELGTPLSTITVVAKEMMDELEKAKESIGYATGLRPASWRFWRLQEEVCERANDQRGLARARNAIKQLHNVPDIQASKPVLPSSASELMHLLSP